MQPNSPLVRLASFTRRLASTASIWLVSLASAICVLGLVVALQWFIYDDWMHEHTPLQIFGSLVAAALTCFSVARWQFALRRRRLEMVKHFQTIEWMNDRIRNSLQSIDLLAFAHSDAAEHVRTTVDAIAGVLKETLEENNRHASDQQEKRTANQNILEIE